MKRQRKGEIREFDIGAYNREAYYAQLRQEFTALLENSSVFYHFQPLFSARDGHVVAYEQFAMRNDNELTSMLPDTAKTVMQDGNVLSISGEQFHTALNLETAQLTRYEALGVDGTFHALIVPGEGPKGSFYRAATDNDRAFGSGLGHMNAAWKEPGAYVVTNRALYAGENPIRVTFDGCYPALENMLVSLEYRFYGDGSIRVQMHLSAPEHQQLIYIPVVGMQMTLPKVYERMTYFGCGPEENYTDRHSGTKVGCYETTVTDNFFPYMEPSETGNRTGVLRRIVRRWKRVRCTTHQKRSRRQSTRTS